MSLLGVSLVAIGVTLGPRWLAYTGAVLGIVGVVVLWHSDRFTDRAKKVMNLARQEAQRFNHEYLGTEHILLGLVQEGSGVAANVLKNMGIALDKIRAEVEKIVKPGPPMVTVYKLRFTPGAKKVLEASMEEAGNLTDNYIGTEHLLLGLIKENEGIAAQVLLNLDAKLEEVRDAVGRVRSAR